MALVDPGDRNCIFFAELTTLDTDKADKKYYFTFDIKVGKHTKIKRARCIFCRRWKDLAFMNSRINTT